MMKPFSSEILLPDGEYRKRKDFQFFLFLHTGNLHFAQKYLFHSSFTLLRRKLLSVSNHAVTSAADGFSAPEQYRVFFTRCCDSFRETADLYTIYIKMKKYRLFQKEDPVMQRLRSFHVRSLEEFRTWISIERYDSDLLLDETDENMRSKTLFYPSSAELAANGLRYLTVSASYLSCRMSRRMQE